MVINRKFNHPNKNTFSIKSIREILLVAMELSGENDE